MKDLKIKNRFTGEVIISGKYESTLKLLGANRGVNLEYANLIGADLRDASFIGSNLRGADLRDASFIGSNLRDSNLRGADLRGQEIRCPAEGSFTAYKKADDLILTLEIPSTAKRVNAIGSCKCRASKVKVIKAETLDGKRTSRKKIKGDYNSNFYYTVGKIAKADSFNPDNRIECSHGIHFFMTKEEAIDY